MKLLLTIFIFIVAVIALSSMPSPVEPVVKESFTPQPYVRRTHRMPPRPINMSEGGAISSFDAALTAQHAAGIITLNPTQQRVADVTGDGTVSSLDAAEIGIFVVGAKPARKKSPWMVSVRK